MLAVDLCFFSVLGASSREAERSMETPLETEECSLVAVSSSIVLSCLMLSLISSSESSISFHIEQVVELLQFPFSVLISLKGEREGARLAGSS